MISKNLQPNELTKAERVVYGRMSAAVLALAIGVAGVAGVDAALRRESQDNGQSNPSVSLFGSPSATPSNAVRLAPTTCDSLGELDRDLGPDGAAPISLYMDKDNRLQAEAPNLGTYQVEIMEQITDVSGVVPVNEPNMAVLAALSTVGAAGDHINSYMARNRDAAGDAQRYSQLMSQETQNAVGLIAITDQARQSVEEAIDLGCK